MYGLKKYLNSLSSITGTAKVHPQSASHEGTEMQQITSKRSGGKKRTRRVKHRRSKHRKSKSRRH
jgi:hypothetical protein